MAQYVEVNGQNVEFPDGMAVGDIEAALKKNALSLPVDPAIRAGKTINAGIGDVPRQVGLTARYGLEGLANAAQVVTEPIRHALIGLGDASRDAQQSSGGMLAADGRNLSDLITGKAPAPQRMQPLGAGVSNLLDSAGLPTPQTPTERVVGDATRLVAGAGGAAGAASKLSQMVATPVSNFVAQQAPNLMSWGQNTLRGLAANVPGQIGAATGAGLAGGASREAGGSPLVQAGASLIGGVAGGFVPGTFQSVWDAGRRIFSPSLTPQQLDVQLSTVLGKAGADYSQLPASVQNSLRNQLKDSLQAGKELDPAAVSRLADFARVGATPTRGMVSQNPVQITREQNLAKMAANSADGELHGLPMIQNQNNATLIRNLNNAGGGTETLPIAAGRLVQDRIAGTNAGLQTAETSAWNAARAQPGYTQPISNKPLHDAFKAVDDEGLIGFMPPEVTSRMQAFMTGQQPFTPQEYRNLRSVLSRVASPENANGNQRYAAGVMGRALDAGDMRPVTNPGGIDFGNSPITSGLASALRQADAQPGNAINAIDAARRATAAKYGYQESSPLVRAALSDARTADPEKIAQSFILNGTVNDARSVAQEVGPQGIATIRDTLATYIKKQALGGASDETGKVSQSALNAVLRKIGDEKLGLFFSPEEVAGLRATGRVASLIQSQPVGSAVNNSNSGALVLGRGADMLGALASKIPMGKQIISDPLRNINITLTQRQAQNAVPGLLAPVESRPLAPSLLLPGLAAGGGLLSP